MPVSKNETKRVGVDIVSGKIKRRDTAQGILLMELSRENKQLRAKLETIQSAFDDFAKVMKRSPGE